MRTILISLLVVLAALAHAQEPGYSDDAYATCSACHLEDGAGVPGAFPRIRNRAARIAALDDGREFLATVVSYGLMGAINVDGNQYFGVMPGNAGAMSNEELAAALNYVVFELNDGEADGIEPFTADEIATVQAATTLKSPAAAGELRADLIAANGEAWP
jgi:hypothetical protein